MMFKAGGDSEEMRLMMMQQVDQSLRHAVQSCIMALPADKRTVEEVERQIRRLVERAFRDLREDFDSFGRPGQSGPQGS